MLCAGEGKSSEQNQKKNGRMGGSEAETIRQPRDRLKGHPQEREHSDAGGGTQDRVPRRGVPLCVRDGSHMAATVVAVHDSPAPKADAKNLIRYQLTCGVTMIPLPSQSAWRTFSMRPRACGLPA